jgi:hypothetical protein
MMPGRTLHRLAARVCSAQTLERVVEPAIAELQKEYAGEGIASRRAWVLLAGYAAIVKVMAMCAVSISVPSDDEWRALSGTFVWSVASVIVTAALLILPPLYGFDDAIRGWYAAATLMPQAMALAIPVGVAFGIAFGLCARPTISIAKTILVGAVAASALSFGILAWAIPAGNQAFREITFRELKARGYQGPVTGPRKGYSEMTLSELRGEIARLSVDGDLRPARQFVFRLHLRFALAAATFALASLLLAAPVNHRGLRGLLAFTVCFVYWTLIFAGDLGSRRGYLTPPLGAWLPNIVMIAFAIFIASSRSSRLRGSSTSAP